MTTGKSNWGPETGEGPTRSESPSVHSEPEWGRDRSHHPDVPSCHGQGSHLTCRHCETCPPGNPTRRREPLIPRLCTPSPEVEVSRILYPTLHLSVEGRAPPTPVTTGIGPRPSHTLFLTRPRTRLDLCRVSTLDLEVGTRDLTGVVCCPGSNGAGVSTRSGCTYEVTGRLRGPGGPTCR